MALVIEYERADRRRHNRVTAPLFVHFNKKQYRAVDWSVGGLRLDGIRGKLPAVGERLSLELILPYQDFKISFEAEAEVVRHIRDRQGFAVKFVDADERRQEIMSHFIDEITRGAVADVGETLARMDVPLTPVSMQPDEAPDPLPSMPWWRSRELLVPVFYGLLGLLVFGYGALVIWSNVFHLVVETAVVGGRVGIIKAQTDGTIRYSEVKTGQLVKAGQIIAQISDPVLEARIEKAAIGIKRKLAEQDFLRRQTGAASDRARNLIQQKSSSLERQRQRVKNIVGQLRQARRKYDRLSSRKKRSRAKKQRLEKARLNLSKLRLRLKRARTVLRERERLVAGSGYIGVSGGRLVVSKDPLYQARLELIKNEIELAREDYRALLKLREARMIRAPYAARIVDLPKSASPTVMKGEVVLVLEDASMRRVTAFLTQQEIAKIRTGDRASIYVPAIDKTLRGQIREVTRRFSFVSEKDQSFTWRPKEERNARVVLEILSADDKKAKLLSTGLPAIVMFQDRQPSAFLSYILPVFPHSGT